MHLALQVLASAQALEKAASRIFRPHGLTPAQFNLLNLLSDQPRGLRASALASALIVDPSNVTGLLKRMKQEDLLAGLDNPDDRREHIVGLTGKGRKLWKAASADYERCLSELDRRLSPADRAAAERALLHLTTAAAALP